MHVNQDSIGLKISFNDLEVFKCLFTEQKWIKKIESVRAIFNYYKEVKIMLFDSVDDLSKYLHIPIPSWVKGACYENKIYMIKQESWRNVCGETFGQVLVHELLHVIINNKQIESCPVWINEGLAQYFAEQQYNTHQCKADDFEENIYSQSYEGRYFYDVSAAVMNKLIHLYGIEVIANKINKNTNFIEDNIFGIDNLKKLRVIK